MRKLILMLVASLALAGCCGTQVPDEVKASLDGDVDAWRLVKKDLVQTMPEGETRQLWMTRVASFIVRARANAAWAEEDEAFDTVIALKEELEREE